MQVAVVHDFQAHGFDVVDVFIMLGDEADAEEISNVDGHSREALRAAEGGEVILENAAITNLLAWALY